MKKDGTSLLMEVNSEATRDAGGNVRLITGVARDVTERKHFEETLRDSEKRFRDSERSLQLILDTVPGVIFYKDAENRYLKANKYLADSLGMSRKEIEGRTMWELYPREMADAYWRDDLEVIESNRPKMGIVETYETPQGTRYERTDKIPLKDDEDNTIGVIGSRWT